MNLEEAKAKLSDLSRSTAMKNPKVLISELCSVISFLFDEIERIKTPKFSVRQTKDFEINRQPSGQPSPNQPKPPIPNILPPLRRRGNAGDAE